MGHDYGRKNSIVTRAKENLATKFRDAMSHLGTKNPICRDVHSRTGPFKSPDALFRFSTVIGSLRFRSGEILATAGAISTPSARRDAYDAAQVLTRAHRHFVARIPTSVT